MENLLNALLKAHAPLDYSDNLEVKDLFPISLDFHRLFLDVLSMD